MKRKLLIFTVVLSFLLTLTSCSLIYSLIPVGDGEKQLSDISNKENNSDISDDTQNPDSPDNTQDQDISNDTQGANAPNDEQSPDTQTEDSITDTLLEQGFEKVSDTYANTERSVEELLQALRDGEPMTDSSGADYASLPQTFSEDPTETELLKGTTVQFSDEPWEENKTVESFNIDDFTAEMTPEEKAEWNEMMSKTEEDWAAEIAEMEAAMKELVNSMNEEPEDVNGEDDYTSDLSNIDIPDMDEIRQQIEDALEELPDEYKDMFGDLGELGDIFGGLTP